MDHVRACGYRGGRADRQRHWLVRPRLRPDPGRPCLDCRVCPIRFAILPEIAAPARRWPAWLISEDSQVRLTQYTDFSIRVLIYLGLNPDRRCTIQEVSEGYGISRNHLMKVAQQLASEGFVASARGSGGGLMLSRAPDRINLADVVAEMEPDFAMVECFRENNQCVISPACRLPPMLKRATRAYLDALREYSLADLLGKRDSVKMKLLLKSA